MRYPAPITQSAGRSKPLTIEGLINLFAEKAPEGSTSPVVLHGTPGLALYSSPGDGPIRGMHSMNGVLYVVSGGYLYSVAENSHAVIGAVSGSGRAWMADNGTQLVVVSGGDAWINAPYTGFGQITDSDFPSVSSVAYLDGYFIFSRTGTGQFIISGLYAGASYDALDFASAESAPDDLVAVFVDHRELWLFGERTCEIWQNTGNADFPFERIPGAINERGCISGESIARVDNSLFWLDQDGIVRRAAEGYTPVRISTHAIEFGIASGDMEQATAFAYAQEGHEFYVLTVPNAGTFVYDAATQLWHKRESYGLGRWRAESHAYNSGVHYVGDYEEGRVYTLDLDTYTDNGDTIVAEMVFAPIQNDGDRFRVHSFQLDMETSDSTAQVMMQTSKDGKTWGYEHWIDFGTVSGYLKRAVWRRLGQFFTCHLRVRISDPAKRAVYAAFLKMSRDE